MCDAEVVGENSMPFWRRGEKKGENRVLRLKGYSGTKWETIDDFESEAAFDEVLEEVEDPNRFKRFKLMEYVDGRYKRTCWKENNPDYEPKDTSAARLPPAQLREYMKKEIEGALDEIKTMYQARLDSGMEILTKAYTSSIDILTEAMKKSAGVEVEGVKTKIEQAHELIKLATPTPPAGSKSGGEKEGGFIEELGGVIKDGVKDAVKEGVKARAKEKKISVPEK